MSLADMNAAAADELRHVPQGALEQNIYRMALQQYLLNSLGRRPQIERSAAAAHAAALRTVRPYYREFTPTILQD